MSLDGLLELAEADMKDQLRRLGFDVSRKVSIPSTNCNVQPYALCSCQYDAGDGIIISPSHKPLHRPRRPRHTGTVAVSAFETAAVRDC